MLNATGISILVPAPTGGFPAWSLQDRYLAYLSATPQIQRYDFTTNTTESLGSITSLILPRINGTFWDPLYSPPTNSGKVAYVASRETGRVDLYVMNVGGTGMINLTAASPDAINFLPVWSPDGQWIAFTSTTEAATAYTVRIIPANGTGSIISVPSAFHSLPFWASSGAHLAFWNVSIPSVPTFSMVTFNTSTGAIGTVENFDATVSPDWGRVWEPSGSQYAFMDNFNPTAKTFGLYYSGDGSLIGNGWFPKWRPDAYTWSLTVDPNVLIPPLVNRPSADCPPRITNANTQGAACAFAAYQEFSTSLTWAQLIALILEAEGRPLLNTNSGCIDNTRPGIPVFATLPPAPPTPTPAPTLIPYTANFVPVGCSPVVHNEFAYAVVEQMFNKCKEVTGVNGQCTDEGILRFLGGVQNYRQGGIAEFDYNLRLPLAVSTINSFFTNPLQFGRCPCTTGNVRTEEDAQRGQERTVSYNGYEPTGGYWFSYSYFDNAGGAQARFRYLKIY